MANEPEPIMRLDGPNDIRVPEIVIGVAPGVRVWPAIDTPSVSG